MPALFYVGLTKLKSSMTRLSPRLARVEESVSTQRRTDAPWQRWYNTARWRRLRLAALERDTFTCRICQRFDGDTSQLVADHIRPHRGDERLFWDDANIQTLCKPCHDQVKQKEEQASINDRGVWY